MKTWHLWPGIRTMRTTIERPAARHLSLVFPSAAGPYHPQSAQTPILQDLGLRLEDFLDSSRIFALQALYSVDT